MTAVRAFSAVRRGSRKAGKYEPLRSLGMASSIRPTRVSRRERRSRPLPVSVTVVEAIRAAHPGGSAGELIDLGGHQPLAGKRQQFTDQIGIGPLLDQLEQGHFLVGHRRLRFGSRLATPNLYRRPAMAASTSPRLRQPCVGALRRGEAEAASYTTRWDPARAACVSSVRK